MSVLNYPSKLLVKTMDTGESIPCGGILSGEAGELDSIYLSLFVQGALAGTESLTLGLYYDAACTQLAYQSAPSALASISPAPSGSWLGWVLFTFARQNVNTTDTLYAQVTPSGYTRNGDTAFLSTVYDWPNPVNSNGGGSAYGMAMRVHLYKDLDYTK